MRSSEGVFERKVVRGARSGHGFEGVARYLTGSLGGSCDSRR